MAKITRALQKVFGQNAGIAEIGKFGSLAAGTPEYTTDPEEIQSLAAFLGGWFDAVMGNNSPAIQDMNALCFLFSRQLAYLMQTGVPEWDDATTYYIGSFVTSGSKIYVSLTNDNLNNPVTDTNNWDLYTASVSGVNLLLNGAFDYWQRGTSTTVANGSSTYLADRWYVKNSLGTNGVITYSQVNGSLDGSKYGAKVQITTAPTAAQANGCELYQTIENPKTIRFLDQNASLSVKVLALGNVNQVGIQFYCKATEAKVDTPLGSEQVVSVNTSGYVTAELENVNLPSATITTSGVIGVRIRVVGVSSGNTYDLNNGFVVEQAMLNIGEEAAEFSRAGVDPSAELIFCQRFYEKTYDLTVNPGTASVDGGAITTVSSGTGVGACDQNSRYKVEKRAVPTVTLYNPQTGATGSWYRPSGAANIVAGSVAIGTSALRVYNNAATSDNSNHIIHAVIDAEI